MGGRRVGFLVPAFLGLVIGVPPEGHSQPQHSYEGAYKGSLECAPAGDQARHIRTPLAIIVRNGRIIASTGDISAAVAAGNVDENGAFRLSATAFGPDSTLRVNYMGIINATGGKLTGTQVWTRNGGEIDTRTCEGTFSPSNEPPRKQPQPPQ
jgi:hypothetical protein